MVVMAGDDEIFSSVKINAAHAESAEVKQQRISKCGGLAVDDGVGIKQRNDERFAVGNGIAETNEQMTIGRGGQSFDVECAGIFGSELRGLQQMKAREP